MRQCPSFLPLRLRSFLPRRPLLLLVIVLYALLRDSKKILSPLGRSRQNHHNRCCVRNRGLASGPRDAGVEKIPQQRRSFTPTHLTAHPKQGGGTPHPCRLEPVY